MSAPRAVFVGKVGSVREPGPDLRQKLGILARHLDATIVTAGEPGRRTVEGVRVVALPEPRLGVLRVAIYYLLAPLVGLLSAAVGSSAAIVCQSPYEAVMIWPLLRLIPRRRRPQLVVEVHGDWRTATRLYGSGLRRLLGPFADRLAAAALRRADRVRIIGEFTRSLVAHVGYAGPLDVHVAYSDFAEFLRDPPVSLPQTPTVVFVGSLQPVKAPEVLLGAWAKVQATVPEARLILVGGGPLSSELRRRCEQLEIRDSTSLLGPVPRERVHELLDDSWVLALPSRSEGLPRVVLEAMARGRAVVASRVGGIPELVEEHSTGLLVPPDDPAALADGLVTLLQDRKRAMAYGRRARVSVEQRNLPAEFEDGVRRLADWIVAGSV